MRQTGCSRKCVVNAGCDFRGENKCRSLVARCEVVFFVFGLFLCALSSSYLLEDSKTFLFHKLELITCTHKLLITESFCFLFGKTVFVIQIFTPSSKNKNKGTYIAKSHRGYIHAKKKREYYLLKCKCIIVPF